MYRCDSIRTRLGIHSRPIIQF